MSTQARLPPLPLPADIETLLAYERDFTSPIDIVRARVLARAKRALQSSRFAATSHDLVIAGEKLQLPEALAILVVVGFISTVGIVLARHRLELRSKATKPTVELRLTAPVSDAAPLPLDNDHPKLGTPVTATRRTTNSDGLEELWLLERARQSDRRGDYGSVLATTREHQQRFPDGRLVEEREALRIRALVILEQTRDARQSAALFRRNFPRSILLESIDHMISTLH